MKKKRGRTPDPRTHIDRERFDEALDCCGYTLTSLAEALGIPRDVLYKQRDNQKGMHVKLLDSIAELLDVNSDFIKGRLNFYMKLCKPEYSDRIMRIMLENGKFPYKMDDKIWLAKSKVKYKKYYETIIPAHGIMFEEFQSMPFETRLEFQAQLESAIGKVFSYWFGGDPEKYEYLSVSDYADIEEIYDWYKLDEIVDQHFDEELEKCEAAREESEKNMASDDVMDDDEMVEETIIYAGTGKIERRMVRRGDVGLDLMRKYGIEPEEKD